MCTHIFPHLQAHTCTIAHTYTWLCPRRPYAKSWAISWRNKHPDLCKDISFVLEALLYLLHFPFHLARRRKNTVGEIWSPNTGPAFHMTGRSNQGVTILTMRLPAKHLLQVQLANWTIYLLCKSFFLIKRRRAVQYHAINPAVVCVRWQISNHDEKKFAFTAATTDAFISICSKKVCDRSSPRMC